MKATQNNSFSIIERGPGFKSAFGDLGSNINSKSITAGVIAAIFGCTGPALVTIKASADAGFTPEQTISWLFGIYVFGGLISIIMSMYYKMPIVGAYSIPGASMLGAALLGFTFNEAAGAFIMAGVLVLLLGLTGLMGKVMKWLPLPIVMGMISGAMLRFGTAIVTSSVASPIVGFAALAGFFVVPRLIKGFPPVLSALIIGLITAVVTNQVNFDLSGFTYVPPQLVRPAFNVSTILSVSIPLAALVVGAENAQAVGVLYAQSYKTPVNAMTIVSGLGGIAAGLFGAHNANVAGPMTAICASEEAGEKEKRYTGAFINGICFMAFGLLASIAMAFVKSLPAALISILAGVAMINVLTNSLKDAFSTNKFKLGAFAALVIAMSGISVLHIGSAFWALLGGVVISLITESKDFSSEDN